MKAPGYNSYRWIKQDWRSVRVSFSDGHTYINYDKLCGEKGTRTKSGKPRLCLPRKVITTLLRSKSGTEALVSQAVRKSRAKKGQRVRYNERVASVFRDFQSKDKTKDRK